jgi:dienelactone hydrolase
MPEFTPYQVEPHLKARFDAVSRKLGFNASDTASWQHWRTQLRAKLREITGYDSLVPAPSDAVVLEEVKFDGYTRQRIDIHTEPDVVMPIYVLVPDDISGPVPAIMTPHGHGSGGKYCVVDNRIDEEVSKAIDFYNYTYAVQYVREGFIVFAPDARGFGERQERGALERGSLMASSCQALNNMAYPLGQTVTGMWTWDMHRLVDYIQSRPDADGLKIGCAGLSGGGLQTLWAAALDERIGCAVVSGYMYGYKQSLLDQHGHCSCNYVPHLYEYADMGDIAALIAPRPLLIETGDEDTLNGADGLDNVKPQVEIAREAYRVAGNEDDLYHDIFHGPHRWNGIEAVPWMRKHLMDG